LHIQQSQKKKIKKKKNQIEIPRGNKAALMLRTGLLAGNAVRLPRRTLTLSLGVQDHLGRTRSRYQLPIVTRRRGLDIIHDPLLNRCAHLLFILGHVGFFYLLFWLRRICHMTVASEVLYLMNMALFFLSLSLLWNYLVAVFYWLEVVGIFSEVH
jgi:hypothetical protein